MRFELNYMSSQVDFNFIEKKKYSDSCNFELTMIQGSFVFFKLILLIKFHHTKRISSQTEK